MQLNAYMLMLSYIVEYVYSYFAAFEQIIYLYMRSYIVNYLYSYIVII